MVDTLDQLRHNLIKTNLALQTLINDIKLCDGSSSDLNTLNATGRYYIANIRAYLNELSVIATEELNEVVRKEIFQQIDVYKEELAASLSAFQKVNVDCSLRISKKNRDELLDSTTQGNEETTIRKRTNQAALLKQNATLTNQMLSVGQLLSDTTKHSADTLETLLRSSSGVTGISEELRTQNTVIKQCGKVADKYQQREFTDKVLIAAAFLFFVACALYVVYCRI